MEYQKKEEKKLKPRKGLHKIHLYLGVIDTNDNEYVINSLLK